MLCLLQLFDHIADCLALFVKEYKVDKEVIPLGFTFSFPCRQEGLTKARLVQWTKGFTCANVEGEDVVELLQRAIHKRGVRLFYFLLSSNLLSFFCLLYLSFFLPVYTLFIHLKSLALTSFDILPVMVKRYNNHSLDIFGVRHKTFQRQIKSQSRHKKNEKKAPEKPRKKMINRMCRPLRFRNSLPPPSLHIFFGFMTLIIFKETQCHCLWFSNFSGL